jgi:hypothetical protein
MEGTERHRSIEMAAAQGIRFPSFVETETVLSDDAVDATVARPQARTFAFLAVPHRAENVEHEILKLCGRERQDAIAQLADEGGTKLAVRGFDALLGCLLDSGWLRDYAFTSAAL